MSEPVVLVAPGSGTPQPFSRLQVDRVRSEADAARAFEQHWRRALWIAPRASAVGLLARLSGRPRGDQRLLLLGPATGSRHGLLHAIFRFVVAPGNGVRLLPTEDIVDVLVSAEREDLLIGAAVDAEARSVVLYRGSLEPLVVPLAWFKARRGGPKPDPVDFEVIDSGQTVRLGPYEAATDAILYEFDADYRRRAKRRRLEGDRSLGGALRRLRIQKGLSRGDFPGISEKEVARIERGEVKRPHAETVAALAKRLGVRPDDVATY